MTKVRVVHVSVEILRPSKDSSVAFPAHPKAQPQKTFVGGAGNARRTVRSDYPDSDPQDHKSFSVLIMGTDYWHEILRFIEQMAGIIAPSDMQVVYVTDSVDDAIAHIRSHAIDRFALLAVLRVRSHWRWLGERGLPPPLIALSNLRPPGPPARRLPP
jgi:hypothetical protein